MSRRLESISRSEVQVRKKIEPHSSQTIYDLSIILIFFISGLLFTVAYKIVMKNKSSNVGYILSYIFGGVVGVLFMRMYYTTNKTTSISGKCSLQNYCSE